MTVDRLATATVPVAAAFSRGAAATIPRRLIPDHPATVGEAATEAAAVVVIDVENACISA